jgi:phosphoribosylanthranilate isomerase
MMKTLVKMCGITSCEDALLADRVGADCIGVIIEVQGSARSVSADGAGRILSATDCPSVVLLEKPLPEIGLLAAHLDPFAVQLISPGDPDAVAELKSSVACQLWQTVRIPQSAGNASIESLSRTLQRYAAAGIDVIVLDTLLPGHKGGTGRPCDWNAAAQMVRSSPVPVFLAGGIGPHTVREAINRVNPCGIDVSSGIELRPGLKDSHKMAALMRAVHNHSCGTSGI